MSELPLLDCQTRGLDYVTENPYSILGLDPGLGKSRIPIELRESSGKKCLIVCPAYAVLSWKSEIERWRKTQAISTIIKKGNELYTIVDSDYVVVSYGIAMKSEDLFEWPNIVVLDEGHELKSMNAKRSQYIHKNIFENSIDRLIIPTGTPIKNRVAEFYSLLALTYYDPRLEKPEFLERFPDAITFADYFSFRHEYILEVNGRFVPVVKWTGLKNVKELRDYLKGRYIRIKSEETDLPPLTEIDVPISEVQDKKLQEAFDTYYKQEGTGNVSPQAKVDAAVRTAPATIKYVQNLLEQVEPVLIYSDHREPARIIAEAFGTVALDGQMDAHKRMKTAQEWQAGNSKVLVATIKALSQTVTLTRSNNLVLNDPPWVPGDYDQVVKRILRAGQTKPCFIHRIHGSPQSQKISKILFEKRKVINMAT